jgi:hypothetical protein
VRTGKIAARAIQILFVAPPAVAGVVSLTSLELSDGIIYLAEALLLLVVIEAGIRVATKASSSHVCGKDQGSDKGGPGYYLDEVDAAKRGAFFRDGDISENDSGTGFYT